MSGIGGLSNVDRRRASDILARRSSYREEVVTRLVRWVTHAKECALGKE